MIKDLHISVQEKPIIKGLNLTVKQGEIHALMGPNGSGKSTLANGLMGHPLYEVDSGEVIFNGVDILELEPKRTCETRTVPRFSISNGDPRGQLSKFPTTRSECDPCQRRKWLWRRRAYSNARIPP